MSGSRLFYHGTDVEVELCDRVEYRWGWIFYWIYQGVVVYLPGVNEPHPEMEFDDTSSWTINLENGTVISWIYLPEELQPSWRLSFIHRKDAGCVPIKPTDELL